MDASRFKEVELEKLKLDPENPRLPKYVGRSQQEMFEFLAKTSSIDELMSAIAENGFFAAEAVIAIFDGENYTVVEGNRRITAVLLLAGQTFDGITKRIIDVREHARHRPSRLPVYVCEDRAEVLNYLGNRHIAGVKAWGALAKARYIRQIFDTTSSSKTFYDRCLDVARVIGSRRDFISRTLRALSILELAEEHEYFQLRGVDEETVKFSIISTAVDYQGVNEFLFSDHIDGEAHIPAVPNFDRVREFFSWLFERKPDNTTLLGESRNLSRLSKVLANEEGLNAIRTGASLDQAYLITTGIDDDFDVLCNQIQRHLREAISIVSDVKPTEERQDLANSIAKQARNLSRLLEDE
ncbi:chromosome partitioning protein ParB [Rhodobacterales bacterium HKCCSP123]|nr:chromosome partitioning protein ParB [Rhodobacterales bacterium HKCCSP123]